MSDESRSFVSFTPVVDLGFLDQRTFAFLLVGEGSPQPYIPWNTSKIPKGYPEECSRALNTALRLKGLAPNTNCILKLY
jgi:hypothetical protein